VNNPRLAVLVALRSKLLTGIESLKDALSHQPGQTLDPECDACRCPVCKHSVIRTSDFCGYCWTKVTPSGCSG